MIRKLIRLHNYFSLITLALKANENGSFCHQTCANTDQAFAKYVPALPEAKSEGEAGTGGKQRRMSGGE